MSKVRVYRRGTTWAYRYEAATVGGKRQQPGAGGFRTKKEAEIAGNKAYNEYLNAGKTFRPSEMSYADLLDEWLEKRCPIVYDEITIDNYEIIVRVHIKPILGKYKLLALDTVHFQNVINQKFKDGYSRVKLSTFKDVMSLSMKYAKELNYIKYNPIYEVKLPSVKVMNNNASTRSKTRIVLSKETIKAIFERFPEGTSPHIAMMLGYRAGLRIGEAFALTWDDIDFESGIIHVQRQIQRHRKKENGDWYFKPCKYDSGRSLPVDKELLALLRRERQRQRENKLYYGQYYMNYYIKNNELNTHDGASIDLIMRRENGEYMTPQIMNYTSAVIHGTKAVSNDPICPEFDFHSLRHTHGTELAEAGAPEKEIQIRLGHKNIETTLNVYVHESDEMKEHTRAILESIYPAAK